MNIKSGHFTSYFQVPLYHTKGRIVQTSIQMTCHTQMISHKRLTDGGQNVAAETFCQRTYRLNLL